MKLPLLLTACRASQAATMLNNGGRERYTLTDKEVCMTCAGLGTFCEVTSGQLTPVMCVRRPYHYHALTMTLLWPER